MPEAGELDDPRLMNYAFPPPSPMETVWLESQVVPCRFWFGNKTVYYVCTEFMKQGPYSYRREAEEDLALLRLAFSLQEQRGAE